MSDVAVRDEVAPFQVMPPLSAEEYAALKADIAENGIEVAVEVDENGDLIDGHHRVKAWTELLEAGVRVSDYPRIRVSGLTHEQKLERARNLNLKRRHLSSEQKKEIAVELRLEGKTQVEIADSLGVSQQTVSLWVRADDVNTNFSIENERGQKRPASYKPRKVFLQDGTDDAEIKAGVEATFKATRKNLAGRVSDAVIVKHTAQVLADTLGSGGVETPDGEMQPVTALLPGLAAESIRESEKAQPFRKEEAARRRAEKLNAILKSNKPLEGVGKFNVIYADPPWQYDFSNTTNREIENHYPTMTIDDICALPVGEAAADDCVLLMWVTSPKVPEAMKLLEGWGFTYRTCMVWVKDKIGMGYYARQKHELLFIATRGELPVPEPANRPASVIEAPRLQHSAKPLKVYELIEQMYPEYSKLELFGRAVDREGWVAWGNQA